MKFSIIVPVYNVEKYIINCLESIKSQTYNNYEVIIVNDGSTDNSEKLIKSYIKDKKNFLYFKKENGGLSDARNYGIKQMTGDYFILVDSDDSINNKLLEILSLEISNNNPDIIKFNLKKINNNNEELNEIASFNNLNINKALPILLKEKYVEPAVMYCYNYSFWKKNNFMYAKGRYHEDFGLTPIIIINSKNVSSLNYIGYNYNIRENSIMTTNNNEKLWKKFNDCLYFFDNNIPIINNNKNINNDNKKLICSYYANGIISKASTLSNDYLNEALKEMKKRNISKYLYTNTITRKIKKILFKSFPKVYIKLRYK